VRHRRPEKLRESRVDELFWRGVLFGKLVVRGNCWLFVHEEDRWDLCILDRVTLCEVAQQHEDYQAPEEAEFS